MNSERKLLSFFFLVLETVLLFGMQQLESMSGKVPGLRREICSSLTQQYIISNPNHPSHLNVNHSTGCAASSPKPGGEGRQRGAATTLTQGCSRRCDVASRNLDGRGIRRAAQHQIPRRGQADTLGEGGRYLRSRSIPCPPGRSTSHCPS